MLLTVTNQDYQATPFKDQFDVDDTTPINSPIAQLLQANLCIHLNGILVGRLDYYLDIQRGILRGRNFNRCTLNRFEKLVIKRYRLDQYWLGVINDI